MADTSRLHDDDLHLPSDPLPPLRVVGNSPADPPAPDVKVGRNGMIGYVVGLLVSTLVITTAGTIGGLGFGPSLGLGAFVGFWGGGGFGFMMGATIPFAHSMDAELARSRAAGGPVAH